MSFSTSMEIFELWALSSPDPEQLRSDGPCDGSDEAGQGFPAVERRGGV